MSDLSSSDPARSRLTRGSSQQRNLCHAQPTPLHLDQLVTDTLTLTTVEGAEDFLHAELVDLSAVRAVVRRKAALTIQLAGTLRGLQPRLASAQRTGPECAAVVLWSLVPTQRNRSMNAANPGTRRRKRNRA
jgi:hypothetical protein